MTRITLVASGSRGDVQPYVALGQGLARAGHDVRLLATDGYETLAAEAGLAFGSTGPNLQELIQTDEWREKIEGGNPLAMLGKMRAEMANHAEPYAERLLALLPGSELIVTGMAGMTLYAAADHLSIPVIAAYVVPFTPTTAFPSPLAPGLPDIGPLNKLSFDLTRQMFWQSSKAPDAFIREKLGLSGGSRFGPFRQIDRRAEPVLYGYSRHVLPHPADWSARYHVTGFWFLDEPEGWLPPDDLLAFLEAGEPPVFIGFGSMGSRDPLETGRIALDALARSGQRGILQAGWGGLHADDVPDTVHLISSMPHSWLFPRMSAVVHHGGVGTTAAGFRAGVPAIVVPFMADQPFWGRLVAELGVGPDPIPRKALTADRLAEAITQANENGAMRRTAAVLGREIQAEDGVGTAVGAIGRYLASGT